MKRVIWIIAVSVVVVAGVWAAFLRNRTDAADIEFRYAQIERGELVQSISSTGVLVALTQVDIRSKAGGRVVRLAVDEGSVVEAGDLIAEIDPEDTRTLYNQAQADLSAAQARAQQAGLNAELQARNLRTAIEDAENALEIARLRLARAEMDAQAEPARTGAELRSAEASLRTAEEALRTLQEVTHPQQRRDADSAVARTRAELSAAEADLRRQEELLGRGFVSQAAVERARSGLEAARAANATAEQRHSTLEASMEAEVRTARARIDQARASLEQSQANQSRIPSSQKTLEEARKAVRAAELNLQQAEDALINERIRRAEVRASEASTIRSRVAMENARVQLQSTRVVAPRAGVVTAKYLEEGTIIPPGTATFAQGTAIVQLSDVTRMFVEVAVDEADIRQVRPGQDVRILVEAYPGRPIPGRVQRINPSATTTQNITAVKVRVEILQPRGLKLLPGMNATCEFLTLRKPGVIVAPSQAVQREGERTFVRVRSDDPRAPVRREVEVGQTGNDGIEIVSGLQPGEEVVVAEINLAQLRDIQRRMLEAQEGGGLAGARPGAGRPGAARPGGGMGGAGRQGGGR
jgi:HlyD family secretion protein